jgi:hypothetical protein
MVSYFLLLADLNASRKSEIPTPAKLTGHEGNLEIFETITFITGER